MSNFSISEIKDIAAAVEAVSCYAPRDEAASKVARVVEIAQGYCDSLHAMTMPGTTWHVKETSASIYHIVVRGNSTDRQSFMFSKRNAKAFAHAILAVTGE
jgi:hypothetical protein